MLTEKEFCAYAEKYIDTVYRVAFSMLKNPHDADDVTQDTFLKLYTSSGKFQSDAHVKNWLIKVSVNSCKNFFRAKWRNSENIDDYAERQRFESQEESELFCAVNALEQKYRIVVHLYYFEGYSTKEIAQLLSTSENTVSSRLHRARGMLRKLMTEV